ncbi:1835_t:CDS:2 [Entrophospora sp. SA101]|nr:1835_t:CDS:2 [Entrophospora sp. SA101]CAJ0839355.1 3095_t:CDS:2 [Entrophospora sp. SA101]
MSSIIDIAPGMARGLTIFFGVCFIIMALVYVFGIIASAFVTTNRQSEVDLCTEEYKPHCDSNVTAMIWMRCILMFIAILFGMYFAGVASRLAQKLETNYRMRHKHKGVARSSSVSIQSVSSNDYNPHATIKNI